MSHIRNAPRWFLLATLVYSPWAFGSTRPWTMEVLKWLLLTLAGLFLFSLLIERRRPAISSVVWVLVLGVLGLGWWMTVNARAAFDPVGPQFHPIAPWISWLPGTMDQPRSFSYMLRVTGLMSAFLVAADMLSDLKWRDRLWIVISLVGFSIVLFGVIQRVAGARSIFWIWGEHTGRTFFATYRYHANAGAFINLVLPFIVGRAIWVFRNQAGQISKGFWTFASIVTVAAAFLNVSRAAMIITILLGGIFAVWWVLLERRDKDDGNRFRERMRVLAILAAIVALAYAFGFERTLQHWERTVDNLADNMRYQVYAIIWDTTLPQVGWGGAGPGTFELVFPLSIKAVHDAAVGHWYWVYAHEDYLQTLVEWGWLGGALWAVLLLGGLGMAVYRTIVRRDSLRTDARYLLLAASLALTGVCIHALVDFPLQIGSLQLYTAMACAVVWTVGLHGSGQKVRRRRRELLPKTSEAGLAEGST